GVHLRVPDDGPARLRHHPYPLRARPAPGRVEVAEALPLVVSRGGRLPRGRDESHPERFRHGGPAALRRRDRRLQRARRHPDRGPRHLREASRDLIQPRSRSARYVASTSSAIPTSITTAPTADSRTRWTSPNRMTPIAMAKMISTCLTASTYDDNVIVQAAPW